MNSLLPKTAALLCAALMAGSLAACQSKPDTKGSTPATTAAQQATETTAAAQPTTGAAPEAQPTEVTDGGERTDAADNALVGSWEYESGGFTYTFNSDGTGVYDVAGTEMKFTYTAENSVLAISYEGTSAPMELNYELNGDTLNVKDSGGNDTIYHRK